MTRCELHLRESSAWALTDSLSYSVEKPNSELSSQCQSLGSVGNSQGLPAKEAEISERLSLQSKAQGRGEVSAWQSGKILTGPSPGVLESDCLLSSTCSATGLRRRGASCGDILL